VRHDVHPLDLGDRGGTEDGDVGTPPRAGRGGLAVDVPDEEAAGRRLEHRVLERGVVAAAVAQDVLGLDLLDQPQRVWLAVRDPTEVEVSQRRARPSSRTSRAHPVVGVRGHQGLLEGRAVCG
jgi:hypothetical protein